MESFFTDQRNRLFLWCPVAFGLGIGFYFSLLIEPAIAWKWVALAAFILLCFCAVKAASLTLKALSLFVSLIFLGYFTVQFKSNAIEMPPLSRSLGLQEIHGVLESVQESVQGKKILMHVEELQEGALKTPFRLQLLCKVKGGKDFFPGDRLHLKAKIMPPFTAFYPGGFDFRRKAFFDQVKAAGFVTKILSIKSGEENWRERYRFKLTEKIYKAFSEKTGAIASALLTGHTGKIDHTVRQSFSDAGLAHILAISGLHLGLVGFFAFLIFRIFFSVFPNFLLRISLPKVSAVGAIGVAFIYLNLAGRSLPTQRAFITFSLMMGAVILERNPFSLRLVALAALIMLGLQPEALVAPGFQMSFAAVTALLVFYEKMDLSQQKTFLFHKGVLYAKNLVLSSLIASCATLPFTLYHFHKMSFVGILSNFLAIPLLTLWIMPLGLVILVSLSMGLSFAPLISILEKGLICLLKTAELGSQMPGACLPLSVPFWGFCSAVFGGVWFCIWEGKVRWIGMMGVGLFLLSLWMPQEKTVLLTTQDLKNIGLVVGKNLYVFTHRKGSFLSEVWALVSGIKSESIISLRHKKNSLNVRKEGKNYFIDTKTQKIAYLDDLDGLNLKKICELFDIVISKEPLRGQRKECLKETMVIDRFDVFCQGPYKIVKNKQNVLGKVSYADLQGQRPWSLQGCRGRA